MSIRFRPALPADLPLLLRWGATAHVIAAAGLGLDCRVMRLERAHWRR